MVELTNSLPHISLTDKETKLFETLTAILK